MIAVDEITDELKGIVRYINQHTTAELQFIALELTYIADDGLEILVPETYGEETIQSKRSTSIKTSWDEASVFEALERCCTQAGVQAVRRLYDFVLERGGRFHPGVGGYPSTTAHIPIGGRDASVFTIYVFPSQQASVYINFRYILSRVSDDIIARFANRLRTDPAMKERLLGLKEEGYRKHPSMQVDSVLAQPGAMDTFLDALGELLASATEANVQTPIVSE